MDESITVRKPYAGRFDNHRLQFAYENSPYLCNNGKRFGDMLKKHADSTKHFVIFGNIVWICEYSNFERLLSFRKEWKKEGMKYGKKTREMRETNHLEENYDLVNGDICYFAPDEIYQERVPDEICQEDTPIPFPIILRRKPQFRI